MRRGVDVVLGWSGADEVIAGADLVITGEGSLDEQSLAGKAPVGVAEAAVRHGVPVVAVSGRRTLSEAQVAAAGFAGAVALTELEPDIERCQAEAGALLVHATERAVRALPVPARRDAVELELHEGRDAARFAEAVWPLYDEVFPGDDHDVWIERKWNPHSVRDGFRLALARRGSDLIGFAWGYTGQSGQWWADQVAEALGERAEQWVGGHFELVELGVAPTARGLRLGSRLHDLMLDGLPHDRFLLSTSPDPDDPGRRLYHRRGWQVLADLPWGQVLMGRRAS